GLPIVRLLMLHERPSDVGRRTSDLDVCAYLIVVATLSVAGYLVGRCGLIDFYTMRYELLSPLGAAGLAGGALPPPAPRPPPRRALAPSGDRVGRLRVGDVRRVDPRARAASRGVRGASAGAVEAGAHSRPRRPRRALCVRGLLDGVLRDVPHPRAHPRRVRRHREGAVAQPPGRRPPRRGDPHLPASVRWRPATDCGVLGVRDLTRGARHPRTRVEHAEPLFRL